MQCHVSSLVQVWDIKKRTLLTDLPGHADEVMTRLREFPL